MLISESRLRAFTQNIFTAIGCSPEHAQLAADVLLLSDMRGIDSHGVARLSGYVRLWEKGRINPTPNIRVVHETATTATVDGDAGLGLVVAPFAMQVAIQKAAQYGSGWVSVRNSNHFGTAMYFTRMAALEGCVGFLATNASPAMAPWGGREIAVGTNPWSWAAPAGSFAPLMAAMIVTGALGNWLGERALSHTSERRFRVVLQLALTALALRLIWTAVPDLGWF